MRFCRPFTLVLLVAALLPATASSQDVRVVTRDEPLGAAALGAARQAPLSFNLVGIHWQGSGDVSFRTAGAGGWSAWRPARPEDEDLPDPRTDEARAAAGWNVGNPWWTGGATEIQYRISGDVTRLRTFFVSSPVTAADAEAASGAGHPLAPAAAARAAQPAITRRKGWGADESIVRGSPYIVDDLELAVVHHTAGTNSYSASQSAAIVRGIQRYHVLSNGWNDIGYNFLVDKYGKIFEGRVGGIANNVVGAHAQGFNTGSVGVAVLGNYQSGKISAAARAAVEKLLAWRLDVGHVDPASLVDAVSYGNDRFKAGTKIRLRAVSGHRDTGYTSCPGTALYGQLGTIAKNAAAIGLPKLYDPEVAGGVGEHVRFTARLSGSRAWKVEVKDAAGAVVAEGTGKGRNVDWTWDATAAPVASYRYVISSGTAVREATGPVPGPPPLAITSLKAAPAVLTPNGDWAGERSKVSFSVNRRASMSARVVNGSGTSVRSLLATGTRPAGQVSLTWDGRNGSGGIVPDGLYRIEVFAEVGVEEATRSVTVTVDRTLGEMAVTEPAVSPNADGAFERTSTVFELRRQADVRVEIRPRGKTKPFRTLFSGTLAAGAHEVSWNGRGPGGKRAPDGRYTVVVFATTSLGRRALTRPVVVDTTKPVLRIVSRRTVKGVLRITFDLSEPARLKVWYGRTKWWDGSTITLDRPAGRQAIWRRVDAGIVRMRAVDAVDNRSTRVFRVPG